MRQRTQNRRIVTVFGLLMGSAAWLGGCGGSSMNSGSMPINPGAPPPPSSSSAPPAVLQAQQENTAVNPASTAVPAPMFTITLDHPFLYSIRDDQTGELLLIGTLMNPG